MSDFDPSLILLLTYCPGRKCSYLRFLKIFNQAEQEEELKQRQKEEADELGVSKSYSMAEDDAKRKLIQTIRDNLQDDPAVNRDSVAAFSGDNVQIKLDMDF